MVKISCQVKYCKQKDLEVRYGYEICRKDWLLHCDNKINLKEKLGIKEEIKEFIKKVVPIMVKPHMAQTTLNF